MHVVCVLDAIGNGYVTQLLIDIVVHQEAMTLSHCMSVFSASHYIAMHTTCILHNLLVHCPGDDAGDR